MGAPAAGRESEIVQSRPGEARRRRLRGRGRGSGAVFVFSVGDHHGSPSRGGGRRGGFQESVPCNLGTGII